MLVNLRQTSEASNSIIVHQAYVTVFDVVAAGAAVIAVAGLWLFGCARVRGGGVSTAGN